MARFKKFSRRRGRAGKSKRIGFKKKLIKKILKRIGYRL